MEFAGFSMSCDTSHWCFVPMAYCKIVHGSKCFLPNLGYPSSYSQSNDDSGEVGGCWRMVWFKQKLITGLISEIGSLTGLSIFLFVRDPV